MQPQRFITGQSRTAYLGPHILLWLLPGILPLVARYLPFQDWPGHVGAVAAISWHQRGALSDVYYFNGWIGPNRLFYALAVLLTPIMGADWASNWTLGFFLAAVGPSAAFMLRSAGADWRWASALPPLVVGRVLACGFGSNASALGPFALMLAGALLLDSKPRVGALVLLAGGLFTLGLHAFVFLVGWALVAAALSVYLFKRRGSALTWGSLAWLAMTSLIPLFGTAGGNAPATETVRALVGFLRPGEPGVLLKQVWEWLYAFHRNASFDDVTQAFWLIAIISSAFLGLRKIREVNATQLVTLFVVVCLVGFILIPENIGAPVNWWGGNLRIPSLLIMPVLVLCGLTASRFALIARRAAIISGLAAFAFVAHRVVDFDRNEMDGFTALVAGIPANARVCGIHFSDAPLHEFPGEPHWYTPNYYLVHQSGVVALNLFGNPGEPIGRKSEPLQPGWGTGAGFSWQKHWDWCDFLLVRTTEPSKFRIPPSSGARIKSKAPRWLLIEKTTAE